MPTDTRRPPTRAVLSACYAREPSSSQQRGASMRTSISIGGAASGREDFQKVVDFAVEAEKLGVDAAWSAEAWGQDAVSPLAYIAARTDKLLLGTGIMQISA